MWVIQQLSLQPSAVEQPWIGSQLNRRVSFPTTTLEDGTATVAIILKKLECPSAARVHSLIDPTAGLIACGEYDPP